MDKEFDLDQELADLMKHPDHQPGVVKTTVEMIEDSNEGLILGYQKITTTRSAVVLKPWADLEYEVATWYHRDDDDGYSAEEEAQIDRYKQMLEQREQLPGLLHWIEQQLED